MAILTCVCVHESQDKLHGKQQRVFNRTRKESGTVYRCTVCLNEKTLSSFNLEEREIK